MAKETIPGMELLPEGKYVFEVVGVPVKQSLSNGGFKRIWTLNGTDASGKTTKKKFYLFPGDYYPIVLAIGGVKNGKDVDWDDDEVEGRRFSCDLKIVKSKDGKYDNYKFESCEEDIAF